MKDLITPALVFGIVFTILGSFVLSFVFLFLMEVPPENKTLIDLMLGALIGSVTTIVSFYFGSSLGSKAKDQK